jgi:hypothetical protein
VLNLVAQALIRVAPVYVADPATGKRRRLADGELLQARVARGATVLVLANGRRLKRLSILRSDLRRAIEVLRRAGVKGFALGPTPKRAPEEHG